MNKFLILFFISLSLSAQISGVVKDSITGQPIPYVNIWAEDETIGTISEIDGSFSLEIKEEKVLVFSALGYEIKKMSSKNEIILLTPKAFELNEVVIERPQFKKEIEINFESIKNLEETKNLNISDEEINKIDKQTILDWIDNTVLVKKQNEEDLESIKIEDNKQFFELSKTNYITSSIKGTVEKNKICEKCQGKKEIESEEGFERCNVCYGTGKISVNPIEFKWDGKKFITTQQQNTINRYKYVFIKG